MLQHLIRAASYRPLYHPRFDRRVFSTRTPVHMLWWRAEVQQICQQMNTSEQRLQRLERIVNGSMWACGGGLVASGFILGLPQRKRD